MSNEHWYTRDGEPMHSIIGKNGKERPTTLRDAKKLGLLPSVTSILGIVHKYQLEQWKLRQLLAAAQSLPDATDEEIMALYEEETGKAADLGKRTHSAICGLIDHVEFDAEPPQMDDDVLGILQSFDKWYIEQNLTAVRTEFTVVGEGYAGTVDWFGKQGDQHILIDWKTTKSSPEYKTMTSWPSNGAQLAAYWLANGHIDCLLWNVMVSTTEPGRIEVVDWTENRAEMLEAFLAAKELWCSALGKGWRP